MASACSVRGAPRIEPTADEKMAPHRPGRISQAPSGAVAYEIRRATEGCWVGLEPVGSSQEPATSFVDEPAAEGRYGYVVSAVPSMGTLCSAASACIEVDLECTSGAPDVEVNSLRLAKSGTELSYSWSSSGSGFWRNVTYGQSRRPTGKTAIGD